jgi:predicted  nucleic acid-binding Zn-ribbon protein
LELEMAREFMDFSVEELQGYYSDFHKDLNGFRPRGATEEQWSSKQFLVTQINSLHNQMDQLKETFEGREQLREQGWIIEEPNAELAQQAQWLAQEREREQAEAMAELDATYYGVA